MSDVPDPDAWPIPPAWMWGCQQCATLYKGMKDAIRLVEEALREDGPGIDGDPLATVPATQTRLAEHLAREHTADLPPPQPGCARCAGDAVGEAGLPHRARHVFAPPRVTDGP